MFATQKVVDMRIMMTTMSLSSLWMKPKSDNLTFGSDPMTPHGDRLTCLRERGGYEMAEAKARFLPISAEERPAFWATFMGWGLDGFDYRM